MSVEGLLELLAETLGELEIPHMLTGSLASSYHGIPRATRDVDVVIQADADQLSALSSQLRSRGLYVSDEAMFRAAESRSQFNAIDATSGSKIDFIMLKERPFSQAEFSSRISTEVAGHEFGLVRAEDLIVAKLEWARMGESERQIRDVAGILAVQGESLDRDRVEKWAEALGLSEQWEKVLKMEQGAGET